MCGKTKGQLVVGWWGVRSEEGPPGVQVLLLYSWDPDRVSDLSRSESPGLHNTTSRPKGGGMKKTEAGLFAETNLCFASLPAAECWAQPNSAFLLVGQPS